MSSARENDPELKTTVQRVRELRQDRIRLREAANGQIKTLFRQFACPRGACDNMWWRRVPERKQVSKCNRCRLRYEPVPREREWGIGVFNCPGCNSTFHGWIQMGRYSTCRGCLTRVFPSRILQPDERRRQRGRTWNQHSCEACQSGIGICAHPQARRREGFWVLFSSNVHVSSGSTVDTFLPQIEDIPIEDVYDRISPIPEEPDNDSDDE